MGHELTAAQGLSKNRWTSLTVSRCSTATTNLIFTLEALFQSNLGRWWGGGCARSQRSMVATPMDQFQLAWGSSCQKFKVSDHITAWHEPTFELADARYQCACRYWPSVASGTRRCDVRMRRSIPSWVTVCLFLVEDGTCHRRSARYRRLTSPGTCCLSRPGADGLPQRRGREARSQ